MALREAWLHCPDGQLAFSEQAKLWGLREALRLLGESDDQFAWMAKQVRKSGNGRATGGGHPGRAAVQKFFKRVDAAENAGEAWYPGLNGSRRSGRSVAMTAKKSATIAKSMMAAKRRGDVPCYELAVARCPAATLNPSNRQAVLTPTSQPALDFRVLRRAPGAPVGVQVWQEASCVDAGGAGGATGVG